jgi:hypothetical protein
MRVERLISKNFSPDPASVRERNALFRRNNRLSRAAAAAKHNTAWSGAKQARLN